MGEAPAEREGHVIAKTCAWCGASLPPDPGELPPGVPLDAVSHGICLECSERELVQLIGVCPDSPSARHALEEVRRKRAENKERLRAVTTRPRDRAFPAGDWLVLVGPQEVGVGTEAQCTLLAEHLRAHPDSAEYARDMLATRDRERKAKT